MANDTTNKLAAAFDLASEGYDSSSMSFFVHYGQLLADFSAASSGERVLDICSGTGAVQLPLARRVGSSGLVRGVDISGGMLNRARAKSREAQIDWVEFAQANVAEYASEDRFDLATCGFSVQFFPDWALPMSVMSSHVRPGGRIAISLWAEGFISEHRAIFLEDIASIRPEATKGLRGGTSVKNPEEMAGFLQSSGLVEPVCEHVPYIHSLDGPQAWWDFLMNAGMRRQIEMLTSAELSEFRPMHLENMRRLQTSEGKFLLNMPATLGMGMVTG